MREHHVYFLTNRGLGPLHFGATSNLDRRLAEHRGREVQGFTQRHGAVRSVRVETPDDPERATRREKRLKKWSRAWTIASIEGYHPEWDDLAEGRHVAVDPPHSRRMTKRERGSSATRIEHQCATAAAAASSISRPVS